MNGVAVHMGPLAERFYSVPVKLDLYPGLPHGFGFFPELPQSGKNGADLIGGVMWLLST